MTYLQKYIVFILAWFLLCKAIIAQQVPQEYVLHYLTFNDPIQDGVRMNLNLQPISGPHRWVIGNAYTDPNETIETPDQTRVVQGNIFGAPRSGYLYITNPSNPLFPNAAYNKRSTSNVVSKLNAQTICTLGFQIVEISFFWMAGGDGVNAYGEILWSARGSDPTPVTIDGQPLRLFGSRDKWQYTTVSVPGTANTSDVEYYIRWVNRANNAGEPMDLSIGIDDFTVKGTITKLPRLFTEIRPALPGNQVCQGTTIQVCLRHEWQLCPGFYRIRLSEPNGEFTPTSPQIGPLFHSIDTTPGPFNMYYPSWPCFTVPIPQFASPDICYKIRFERFTQYPIGGVGNFAVDDLTGYPFLPPAVDGRPADAPCFEVINCQPRYIIDTQPEGPPFSPRIPDGAPPTLISRERNCDIVCVNSPLTITFGSRIQVRNPNTGQWQNAPSYLYDPGNEYIGQLLRLNISGRDTTITVVRQIGQPLRERAGLAQYPTRNSPWGSISDLVPDVPDGCNYYLRVISTNPPSIDSRYWGPFCIRHCDIETNNLRPVSICYSCNVKAEDEFPTDPERSLVPYDWYVCTRCNNAPGKCEGCNEEQKKIYLNACKDTIPTGLPHRLEHGALIPVLVKINRWPWPQNAPVRYSPGDIFEIELWQPVSPPPSVPPPLRPSHEYPTIAKVDIDQTYQEIQNAENRQVAFMQMVSNTRWQPSNPPPSQEAIIWLKVIGSDRGGPHPAKAPNPPPYPGPYFFRIISKKNPPNTAPDTIPGFPHSRIGNVNCKPQDAFGQFTTLTIAEPAQAAPMLILSDNVPECYNKNDPNPNEGYIGMDIVPPVQSSCYEWYIKRPGETEFSYFFTTCPPNNSSLGVIVTQGETYEFKVRERAGGVNQGCFGPFSEPLIVVAGQNQRIKFKLNEPPPFCIGDEVVYSVEFDATTPTQYSFAEARFEPPTAGRVTYTANNEIRILWQDTGMCRLKVLGIVKPSPLCELRDSAYFVVRSYADPLPIFGGKSPKIPICSNEPFYLFNIPPLAQMNRRKDFYGKLFDYGMWVTDKDFKDELGPNDRINTFWPSQTAIEIKENVNSDLATEQDSIFRTRDGRDVWRGALVIPARQIPPGQVRYLFLRTRNENGCVARDPITLLTPPDFIIDVGKDTLICPGQVFQLNAKTLFTTPFPEGAENWKTEIMYEWEEHPGVTYLDPRNIPNPKVRLSRPVNTLKVNVTVTYKPDENSAQSLTCDTKSRVLIVQVYQPAEMQDRVCLLDSTYFLPLPIRENMPGKWESGFYQKPPDQLPVPIEEENKVRLGAIDQVGGVRIGRAGTPQGYKTVSFVYRHESSGCTDTLHLTVTGSPEIDFKALKPNYLKFFPRDSAINSFLDKSLGTDPNRNRWRVWINKPHLPKADTSVFLNQKDLENYFFEYNKIFPDTVSYFVELTVISHEGCAAKDTLEVLVVNVYSLIVYNVFTPNGDGVNDRFVVENEGVKEYRLSIFDRWGNQVFFTQNPMEHWDGTRNNDGVTKMQEGAYFYYLEGRFHNDRQFQRSGNVTLLR
ncbi:MAG: gliding motility-associated C-terminal domain-containing protein [Bacteroidia bacterium]|nr:gliding motility-associated C-terminal domain-containing protein [Bacteroidia bacterium]MDW8157993.1 gliding motility-associated C-terminal domain-containing protein [Bacteroidia bacterium]